MASAWSLIKLQQIDSEIIELGKKRENLDTGAALEQETQEAERALSEKQDYQQQCHKLLKDLELQLASVEAHRKKIEAKLFSGSVINPKELASLEKEVELLKKQQSALDDKILPKMDELEKLDAELSGFKQRVQQSQARAQLAKAEYERKLQELDARLEALKEKRDKNQQMCDPALLSKYEEIKHKRDGIAVVKVVRSNCGGCFMNLPQGLLKKVQERHLEFCSNCGRILYIEGE